MIDYEKEEKKILNDDNYDWRKHFLFTLPDILSFLLKLVLLAVLFYSVEYAVIMSILELLPSFCGKIIV